MVMILFKYVRAKYTQNLHTKNVYQFHNEYLEILVIGKTQHYEVWKI